MDAVGGNAAFFLKLAHMSRLTFFLRSDSTQQLLSLDNERKASYWNPLVDFVNKERKVNMLANLCQKGKVLK